MEVLSRDATRETRKDAVVFIIDVHKTKHHINIMHGICTYGNNYNNSAATVKLSPYTATS